MKPTVAYSTFCCAKDMERVHAMFQEHLQSHNYGFGNIYFIHQRCGLNAPPRIIISEKDKRAYLRVTIRDEDYQGIMDAFKIPYPNPVLSELTHGWGAPHFWAHHMVNHLKTLQLATADYIVFADGDCYMKSQPEGKSWVDEGIRILESNPNVFVVSPNDGGDERPEIIMSQQMFLVNRKRMMEMDFIPWDGKFIEGGPFQEFYGLMEGFIYRYMQKNNLCRYVLPSQWRYWHKAFH